MGRYFSLILAGGFVTIPLVGAAMDKLGFPCTCVAIVIFGVIWSGLNLLGDINMVFYSFFFYTLFRSFLYPFVFAYMADVLGYEYFGMIGGIMYMVAAIASLAQIPLTSWAAGSCHIEYNIDCSSGGWEFIHISIIFSLLLLLILPIFDHKQRQQQQRQQQRQHEGISLPVVSTISINNNNESSELHPIHQLVHNHYPNLNSVNSSYGALQQNEGDIISNKPEEETAAQRHMRVLLERKVVEDWA